MLRSPTTRAASSLKVVASTIACLLLVAAMLALPSAALAGKPSGEYAAFTSCPLSSPGVNQCFYDHMTSGQLRLGKMTVRIEEPITLQGGLIVKEKEETWVNPTEGGALSKSPEPVQGGFLSSSMTATMELVGAVSFSDANLESGKGVALDLPVRMHLTNGNVNESCYLGTSASPITLQLTSGTTAPPEPNKPIHGSAGERESKEAGNLIVFTGDSLVENAFSVPKVTPICGRGEFGEFISDLLDLDFELPSAAGHNTATFDGTTKRASAEAVRDSE